MYYKILKVYAEFTLKFHYLSVHKLVIYNFAANSRPYHYLHIFLYTERTSLFKMAIINTILEWPINIGLIYNMPLR